jgi:hypothetical protein
VFWLQPGQQPGSPITSLVPVWIHNPLQAAVHAELLINTRAMITAGLKTRADTAQLLETARVHTGTRFVLHDRERAQLAAVEGDLDHDRRGWEFRPNRKGVIHLDRIELPTHARNTPHSIPGTYRQ